MSYEEQSELHDFQLFGLHFQATFEEQRRLWLQMCGTNESREWGIARHLCGMVVCRNELTGTARELAQRMEDADVTMTRCAAALIDAMMRERQA